MGRYREGVSMYCPWAPTGTPSPCNPARMPHLERAREQELDQVALASHAYGLYSQRSGLPSARGWHVRA